MPGLASDVPGQNTMMDIPGVYWVNSQDRESIKNAIEEAFKKKETGQMIAIKQKQKEYVVANYSINQWVDASIALYDTYFG
jgi:trehalose-6-phosphate synthase